MPRVLVASTLIAGLALIATGARAEQPIPKSCVCNDDCVNSWPYTGICVQNSWGKTCGFSGPGIPCPDGGAPPPPDAGPAKEGPWFGCGDAMPNCSCNDDCKAYGLAYCVKTSTLCPPICSSKGPGIACVKKDVGPEGVTPRSCRCNADCAGIAGMPYCAYQSGSWFCSSVGPGASCPDDPRPYDEVSVARDAGPGAGAAAPRGGCSVGGASASAPGAFLLLLGLALVRRRRR
jgi:MYXO-CTERM domain-containing protein